MRKTLIPLLIILALASFFRLYQLDLIPPGIYPDEAMNANNVLDSLKDNEFKVFYPENNGREGMIIWLIALSFYIFGPSIWALKIVPAFFGILTVLGLYLFTRELLSQKIKTYYKEGIAAYYIALLSSFFLAVSFWHVNFSRIGFRAILIPFIMVFAFYFLLKGFRRQKIYDYVIAGLFFGLGFYTYISFRVSILILALFLILKFIDSLRKNKLKNIWKKVYIKGNWWKVDVFLLTIFLTALPIGIYFLNNPVDFTGRAGPVSIFNTEKPMLELVKSIGLHLAMFNFYGDANWRHNFSGSPQLLWIVGIFFLIGIILSIRTLIASIKEKEPLGLQVSSLLLSWFFVMLLPGFLSAEGVPHALRTIGVIPAAYIFSGIGAYWVFQKIDRKKTLIFIFLLIVSYASFNKYFIDWAKRPELEGAFSKNYVEIGNYLNSLNESVSKYVIVNQSGVAVNGIPVPAQTTMFIERSVYARTRATYLLPEDLDKIRIDKETVIVPLQYDENLFLKLFVFFPEGNFEKINNKLWIYNIK